MLSSWEYQQSPSFLAHPALRDELAAVAPKERFMTIARSMNQLIRFIKEEGFASQIVYAELHNEVEYGQLTAVGTEQGIKESDSPKIVEAMQPYIEEAIEYLREQHPDILMTASYTLVEAYPKAYVARNMQVAHYHLYIRGVLYELMDKAGLNDELSFPNLFVQSLLREDAPPFEEWTLPEGQQWRMEGNPVGMKQIYLHDWVDPDKWDLYLYDNYGTHKLAMLQKSDMRLEEASEWAARSGIPVVIGEGYVGYTPLLTGFEEGPVGKFIAEYALRKGMALGFWGMTLCSNCNSAGETSDPASTNSTAPATNADKPDNSKEVKLTGYLLGEAPKGMPEVLAAINEKLKKDINATLEINYIGWGDVASKYPLVLASGQDVDFIFAADWNFYISEANKGSFLPLDESMIQTNMPKYYAKQDPAAYTAAYVNGKQYMIPTTTPDRKVSVAVLRKDILDKSGLVNPTKLSELGPYFAEIKKTYPDMIPLNLDSQYDLTKPFSALASEKFAYAAGPVDSADPSAVGTYTDSEDPAGKILSITDEPVLSSFKFAAGVMKQ
ncbi:hypothetical protein KC345_g10973, partial [Hortaea werneckii]